MKARIDNILTKYYDMKLNKYIAWCRVKVGNDWRYQRLFFAEKEEWRDLKDLLLKDLCARLPYDVKCKIEMWKGYDVCTVYNINSIGFIEIVEDSDTNGINIERIKPYLFPLSSMTEEQKIIYGDFVYEILSSNPLETQKCISELYDWLNKNHFDYRGLIKKSLAIDATGLNIYKEE
ncbi:MAG: hypothetical protein J6Q61_09695 [Bacteroidales bacterium]|nr:hypothetical protein [Bacteroidales bacterium]